MLAASGKNGFVLILNIIHFKHPDLQCRTGAAEIDTEYMTNLWTQLGYEVFPKNPEEREEPIKLKKVNLSL